MKKNYKNSDVAVSATVIVSIVAEARAAKAALYGSYDPDAQGERKARLEAAYVALHAAFVVIGWGANGSTFVSSVARGIRGPRLQTLFVQSRPVATCTERGWIELIEPDEGERLYTEAKELSSARHKAATAERELLVRELVQYEIRRPRSFGKWFYCEGQKGGVFFRLGTAISLSAPGAMKAAIKAIDELKSDAGDDFSRAGTRRRRRQEQIPASSYASLSLG